MHHPPLAGLQAHPVQAGPEAGLASERAHPQLFINKWLKSQLKDLKTMTNVTGNPEEERRMDYYYQPWVAEGVSRFGVHKVHYS